MNSLVTIATFIYPHEASIAKTQLEEENIEVFLQDEITNQLYGFTLSAIGGIKLDVRSEDADRAINILRKHSLIE